MTAKKPRKDTKKPEDKKKTVKKPAAKKPPADKKTPAKKPKELTPKQKEAAYRKLLREADGLALMKALRENTERGHTENVRIMVDECYLKHQKPQKGKKKKQQGSGGRLWKDAIDWTLPTAAKHGRTEIAKILIEAGADVEVMEGNPLHIAVLENQLEMVDLLLKHGADHRTGDDFAIRYAAIEGHTDIAARLIEAGADPRVQDDYALCWAAAKGHAETVKLLLEKGKSDPHAKNEEPLRRAAAGGHLKVFQTLIAAGADLDKAIEHAVLRDEKYGLLALKLRDKGGWSIIDDFTVAHTAGETPDKPTLTTVFNFSAYQAATTMAIPGKAAPSAPTLQSFEEFSDKDKLKEAEKLLENYRTQKREAEKAAGAGGNTVKKQIFRR